MYKKRFSGFGFLLALLMPQAIYAAEGEGGGAPASAAPANAPAPAETVATPAAVDVNALLAQQQAEFAAKLKAATGFDSLEAYQEADLKKKGEYEQLHSQTKAQLDEVNAKYHSTLIGNAILANAAGAIDPSDLVLHLSGKAVVGADGSVTIDGKPAADAVAALLAAKPHLAKPLGAPGGGSPASANMGGKTTTRAIFDAMTPFDKAAFIKDGGNVTN